MREKASCQSISASLWGWGGQNGMFQGEADLIRVLSHYPPTDQAPSSQDLTRVQLLLPWTPAQSLPRISLVQALGPSPDLLIAAEPGPF